MSFILLNEAKLTGLQNKAPNAYHREENLLPQEKRMPLDPYVGKMILFGAIFGCLDPVLMPAAPLNLKDPLYVPLNAYHREENLLPQEKRMPLDPYVGKMILFCAIFGCLDPVLMPAAPLNLKDPLYVPLNAYHREENLLPQEKRMPLDPYVGKMILFCAIFGCLDPVLMPAAPLNLKDPLYVPLNAYHREENLLPQEKRMPLDPYVGKMILFCAIFGCLDPVLMPAAPLNLKDPLYVPLSAYHREENLLPQEKRMPLDPYVGKMILFGAIFGCLDPILMPAAPLNLKDPLYVPLVESVDGILSLIVAPELESTYDWYKT